MQVGALKLLIFLLFIAVASGAVAKPKPKPPALSSVVSAASASKKSPFPKFASWISQAKRWAAKAKGAVSTSPNPSILSRQFNSAEVEWSNTVKLVYDSLSSYTIQKDRALYNVKSLSDWGQPGKAQGLKGQINEGNVAKFLDQLQKTSPFPQKMASADFLKILKNGGDGTTRLDELNAAIGSALQEDAPCQFDATENTITVQGHSILLSKVVANSACYKKGARSLVLIASHTLFTDGTVVGSDLTPLGLNVYAYAPNWNNVNGNTVSFNLDGAKGDTYEDSLAPKYGQPGKAGLPGKSGGNFVGVGTSFIGGAPTVSARGGEGADGQNGANGVDGTKGEEIDKSMLQIKVSKPTFGGNIKATVQGPFGCEAKEFTCGGKCQKWVCLGGKGTTGRNGGNGGLAGVGGLGGQIIYLNRDQGLLQNQGPQGPKGKPGRGGFGGRGGQGGDDLYFTIDTTDSAMMFDEARKKGYALTGVNKETPSCADCRAKSGANGVAGVEGRPEGPQPGEQFYVKYLPLFGAFSRQRLAEIPTLFQPQLYRLTSSSASRATTKIGSKSPSPSLTSLADLATLVNLNDDLHLLRAPLSYFHELKVMEIQWPEISTKDPANIQFVLLPAYNALLRQVLAKGRKMGNTRETKTYLQGLQYLYTAAYSRALQQPSGMDSILVTDMKAYVETVLKNFKTLQSSVTDRKKLKLIKDTKDQYSKEIEDKFKEAENIIKNTLTKDIERAENKLDGITDSLLKEIKSLRAQGVKKQKELAEAQEKLKQQQKIRVAFGALKMGQEIAKCFGPPGKLGAGLVGIVSGVAEASILGGADALDITTVKIPAALLSSQSEFVTYYTARSAEYAKDAAGQKKSASTTLAKTPKVEPKADAKTAEITKKIQEIQLSISGGDLIAAGGALTPSDNIEALNQLQAVQKKDEDQNAKAAAALQAQLDAIDQRKVELAKQGKTSSDEIVKTLNEAQQYVRTGINILSVPLNVYKQYEKDQDAIDAMSESIQNSKGDWEALRDKYVQVEDNMRDGLLTMKQDIKVNMDGLKNKSPVSLEISKWQVQKNLKSMQSLLSSSFTGGTGSDSTVKKSFETISESMDMLIKVYDRMNEYQAQAKLATFIADINSVNFVQPESNTELGRAIQDIQFVIQANVLRTQYEMSVKSFKMFQFPFAINFLETMAVPEVVLQDLGGISKSDDAVFYAGPSKPSAESAVDQILSDVTGRLDDLYSKISIEQSSIIPSDEFTRVNVPFDDGEDSPGPFFTWKNADFGDDIKRLLKLEPVSLFADIKQTQVDVAGEDGIKFKRVELRFAPKSSSPADKAAVDKLKEKLRGYEIQLTHTGHNYYRNGPDIYSTMIKQLPLISNYVAKRGDPIVSPNDAYNKLSKAPACLSPYTLWIIQLRKIKAGAPDPELELAAASVDLQLSGLGSRVSGKYKSAELRLDQFYDRVEL